MRNLSYKKRPSSPKEIVLFDMPQLYDRGRNINADLASGQRIEDREREAYEIGFNAGEKAGFSMGEQKAAVLIEKIEAILRELITLREREIRELEPRILELSAGIARKILLRELALDPETILGIAKEAMMKLERSGQITIKVPPSLHDLFLKNKSGLLGIHPDIIFDIDPSVSSHGSIIMGPLEDVHTDPDEQIRNIIKDMVERHGGH